MSSYPIDAVPDAVPNADSGEAITSPDPTVVNPTDTAAPAEPISAAAAPFRLALSVDQILYALFILVALVLRLTQLNTIVLGDSEAHEALSVFRAINPGAAGTQLTPHQPLMFAVNALIMAVGGATNINARFGTVMISLIIILMPLLFRRWIGRSSALILSGLLALSPVLLTASRTMSGSVWTLALALGTVWLAGRFVETKRSPYALAASALLVLMLIASEAAGFLMVIMLGGGLLFAQATSDDPDRTLARTFRETISTWPYLRGLLISGIVLAVVGTVFFLHVDGISAFGDLIGRGLQGFVFRPAQNPVAFPLFASLLYEPLFWIFGLIGAWIVLREDGTFLQRGLIGWLIVAVAACLVYPAAEAQHALWLTFPLAGLATITLERILAPIRDRFWNVPIWGPWLHGVGVVATLSICGINLLYVGRAALNIAPALIPAFDQPFRVVLVILTLVLLIILFFLVGSVWGGRAAWHGMGLGVLMFLGVYSLSSGWRASVVDASDPRELWRPHAASQNLTLLQTALVDTSLRAVGMPYDMPLSVVWSDDGALAWAIRYYQKTTFVTQTSTALNGAAILAPKVDEKPQLGAAYVGEPFAVYSTWDRATMQYWDVIAWVYGRETRLPPTVSDRVVLWVRSDVYGVPTDSLTLPSASKTIP